MLNKTRHRITKLFRLSHPQSAEALDNTGAANLAEETQNCQARIATEKQLVQSAPSPEAAELHQQMLSLYEEQLKALLAMTRSQNSVFH